MRFSNKVHPDPTLAMLRQELSAAQGELSQAYRQFNEAVDPELVESSIYQISAVKARCNYLIRMSGRYSSLTHYCSDNRHILCLRKTAQVFICPGNIYTASCKDKRFFGTL